MTQGIVWIYTAGYQDGAARLVRATEANEVVQLGPSGLLVNGVDAVWSHLSPPSRPEDLPSQFLLALAQAVQTARHKCADGHDRVVTAEHSEAGGWQWQVYRLDEVPNPRQREPRPPALAAATRSVWGFPATEGPKSDSPAA